SLLADTAGKMSTYDYTNKPTDLSVASSLLRAYAVPAANSTSPLKLDPSVARDLANKLADTLTSGSSGSGPVNINSIMLNTLMPTFEKILPDRIAQLRASQTTTARPGQARNGAAGGVQAVTRPTTFSVFGAGGGSGIGSGSTTTSSVFATTTAGPPSS